MRTLQWTMTIAMMAMGASARAGLSYQAVVGEMPAMTKRCLERPNGRVRYWLRDKTFGTWWKTIEFTADAGVSVSPESFNNPAQAGWAFLPKSFEMKRTDGRGALACTQGVGLARNWSAFNCLVNARVVMGDLRDFRNIGIRNKALKTAEITDVECAMARMDRFLSRLYSDEQGGGGARIFESVDFLDEELPVDSYLDGEAPLPHQEEP